MKFLTLIFSLILSTSVFSQAFPSKPVHGLALDASGKRLAMGSTTGGLWVSEDQGDSWRCLFTHLPPIYCVRFA